MNNFKAAIYCRISRDDDIDQINKSSIRNQQTKLTDFCNINNIVVYNTYSDIYTGTSYDRPAFNELINDIESGDVNCVVVKDLSRLGREYKSSGQYLENYFPEKMVRFIAVDDAIDLNPYDEYDVNSNQALMIPMFNIINEFYPADISKKTRSALTTKAKQGEYICAKSPFGYVKNPENKNQLIVHPEQADVVRLIFKMYMGGKSLSSISRWLHHNKIKTCNDFCSDTAKYNWNSSTVKQILSNRTYIGSIVYGKSRNLSYKNKQVVKNPKKNWIIRDGIHEAIIQEEVFDDVQRVLKNNSRSVKSGVRHCFSNKLICSTCGNIHHFYKEPRKSNLDEGCFVCSKYKRFGKNACERHYIRASVIERAVINNLSLLQSLGSKSPNSLYKHIWSLIEQCIANNVAEMKRENTEIAEKLEEFEIISYTLYSDYALKKITEERYNNLEQKINEQRKEITKQKEKNEKTILQNECYSQDNIQQFIDKLLSYGDITELNHSIVANIIDNITVFQKVKKFGKMQQTIHINYKFIGKIEELIIDL